jgi:hypothetical protein
MNEDAALETLAADSQIDMLHEQDIAAEKTSGGRFQRKFVQARAT